MKYFLIFGFITIMNATVQAQEVVQLPDGQTALNISATENIEVAQDMLVASLRIQNENKDARSVQKIINEAMAKAVALAKKYPDLKVETGQYYVHPDYRQEKDEDGNRKSVVDQWRGSQTLTLKSEKAETVLMVSGELQDMGFMMNNLNYQLSQKKHEEVRDGLMETTIMALKDRADRVAKALGKSSVDIVEMNIDSNNFNPQPVFARAAKMESMSMMADSMPAPTAQAGKTNVSMTINARAIIKP